MTAQELHALVEPIREAMWRDQLWPTRQGEDRLAILHGEWRWQWLVTDVYEDHISATDAANRILVALLGWASRTGLMVCGGAVYQCNSMPDGHVDLPLLYDEATILHALVAAYRSERGI